jgi:hypothetical protein
MKLDLTDPETDYVYRLLYTSRPMSEVETIVGKIRQQAQQAASHNLPTEGPSTPLAPPNGSSLPQDLPALP